MATDKVEHKCVKCGKSIKIGEEYTNQGVVYCCINCCRRVDTPKGVCEFC